MAKPTLANFTVSVFFCFSKQRQNMEEQAPFWAPEGWGPEGWGGPKISSFFFPLPPQFSFFFLSLGGPFVEFWWCLKRRSPSMCAFGVRSRVWVSLPTPRVTVSRFLLSNLSSGPPTHSPSIRACADHFHSLDRSLPAAALLQSWEGGHLDPGSWPTLAKPTLAKPTLANFSVLVF